MTTQRLRVSGFVLVDCSYETEVDVPAEYAGREIEFLEEQGLLPEVSTSSGGSSHIILMTSDPKAQNTWKYGERRFHEADAEVISD